MWAASWLLIGGAAGEDRCREGVSRSTRGQADMRGLVTA
jgi:hypothetical protein